MNFGKFFSYQLDKKYQKCIESCKSFDYAIDSGVSQGSILVPLLFVIFIDKIENTSDCMLLQSGLAVIHNWCLLNKFYLNVQKCSIVSFTEKINNIVFNKNLNGLAIKRCNQFEDLGITSRIDETVQKAYRMLGFIHRNSKNFKNFSILNLLFISYVRSKLEYENSILHHVYDYQIRNIE